MKFDPRLYKNDKMYGTTVVGARGQVVIPADARRDLNIKPGDRLVAIGKMGKGLGLLKVEQLAELIELFMQNVDKIVSPTLRSHFKQNATRILKSLPKLK